MPPWIFEHHTELPSTQDRATALALGGAHRHAVLADQQTSGRGRAGRAWVAPVGNLNFSAALRPGAQLLEPGKWSLMAGVALHAALAAYEPAPGRLVLKWPNDVLLDGGKLAGVLVESGLSPEGQLDWVVIGIGVNLVAAPAIEGRRTASLAGAGIAPPAPRVLAEAIAARLDDWMGQGLDAIRAAWLACAHPLGTVLRVQTQAGLIEAPFAGLAEDGSLLLEGGHRITSGEVGVGF